MADTVGEALRSSNPGEGRVGEHAIGDQTVTRGTIAAGQIVLDDVEIVERPWVKYGQPADSPIAPLLPASDDAIASSGES